MTTVPPLAPRLLPSASLSRTVIVLVLEPSATRDAGLAVMVLVAVAGRASKSAEVVGVIVVEAVESVAVYVTVSTLESLTVNVATPLAFVAVLAGEIVEKAPAWPSETVFPATRFPCASFSVTVTVAVVDPSASTEPELVATVDVDALTAPGTNWTSAVWATVTESVVSVAVYVTVSATASLTVNVAWPLASVVPATVAIVELPEPAASVTVLPASGWLKEIGRAACSAGVVLSAAVSEAGKAATLEPDTEAG